MVGNQVSHLEVAEVLAAFAQLPSDEREVLFLVVAEGLRYREVATLLGISVGAVMSRLARGREKLRQLVGEQKQAPRLRSVK